MPVMDGVKAAERLSGQCKVMMLTYSDDEPMVAGAIRAGAAGYLVHGRFEPDELTRAVRDLAAGKRIVSPVGRAGDLRSHLARGEPRARPRRETRPDALTEREREVMGFISRGRSNRDIASSSSSARRRSRTTSARSTRSSAWPPRAEAMAVWLGIEREEQPG